MNLTVSHIRQKQADVGRPAASAACRLSNHCDK
jgi:hypothetical protein